MNDELKVVKILERDRYIGIRSRSDMLRKQTYFINCPIMGIQYQTPDFIKAGGSPINLLPAFVKITNELPNTTSIVPSVPTSSREISQNATGQSITTILKSQAQNYLLAAAFAFGGCLFIYLCWFFYHKFATWIISAKSAEIPRLFEHDSKNKTPVVGKPLSHIYINPHHQDPPRLLQLTVNRQLVGSSQSSAKSEEELYGYPDPDLEKLNIYLVINQVKMKKVANYMACIQLDDG
ncbi:uncharacterized protein TRIADDRAFT_51329 [Trichoplax adhaerens]|uniref:Uncharacterized protein n=1 Tax=Trichoplax adhaerens TaxID=10228 RepID=B3RII4_TRIAD|nr:predicted protein [Trichoplax adhaerens]EDV28427.1 predicted protein [Trichoplax adhaerens]|eukprot:XP_002107629.1 predicted protein [Trichoplax adhaerens]